MEPVEREWNSGTLVSPTYVRALSLVSPCASSELSAPAVDVPGSASSEEQRLYTKAVRLAGLKSLHQTSSAPA